MALLLEFLNENAHRYYPFATTTGNTVPTALILDLGIIATTNLPNNSGADSTYISKIVTDGTQVRFYFAAKVGNSTVDFGCLATVDVNNTIGTRTNFKYAGQGYVLEGFIVTGDLTVTANMPATTTLTYESGRIYTGCIQHMSSWLAGVQIGDQTLSGLVIFKAGAGVTFAVDGNTVTISCTGAEIPPDNQIITTDATLFNYVTEQYGIPITSINGILVGAELPEGSTGANWSISAAPDSDLSININGETHSITINNLKAVNCCSGDEIATLVDNIGALNDRVGVLSSFVTQVETNLNIMSVQAARLK